MAKVDNIDTSVFVIKTKYNADKTELKNKIPDASNFVEKNKTYWIRKFNSCCINYCWK